MRGVVLFPNMVLPLSVGRERSLHALEAAVRAGRPFGVVMQRDDKLEEPKLEDLFEFGTVAEILRYVPSDEGPHQVICQGRQRVHLLEIVRTAPYLEARVQRIAEPTAQDSELEAALINLKQQAREAIKLMPGVPDELGESLESIGQPGLLADMVAALLDIPPREKQTLLETLDVKARVQAVTKRLAHMVEVLKLSRDMHERTKGALDKAQREYFLREQLHTIHKELGDDESDRREIQELAQSIVKAAMPPEVEAQVSKELKRLQRTNESSAEYSMLRTWIETALDLPWSKSTDDQVDLARAREVLDEDHHGLDKVKRRILEFLAVRKLKPDGKGPILCLVGPPGVGKTSLGMSIARAMGRKFVRVSLGGVHDESEIRGHRRTYVGALPGNVIQGMRKAGANNPVFMLDEIDKLSASMQGDPSAALLEVLDPEQNKAFRDNYLDLPFDLGRTFFIATANVLSDIPRALRDRCEVIEIPGYVEDEKTEIARRYLIPRQSEQNGLKPEQIEIPGDVLREVLWHYTREAGVRELERQIAAILRRAASRIAAGETERVLVRREDLRDILGPRRFENEVALRTSVSGVATGLAWTPFGGEILFVEATRMPGKGRLLLTGQLGDVMRESAQAALSLAHANAASMGIDLALFENTDLHVHLPAGAIPKDGPSAGVTIYAAIVSLLTGRSIRSDVAMTGEISLRGLVLPVGGIRDKVLAAHAAGIRTVILPARNELDLDEVPKRAREETTFIRIGDVRELLAAALVPATEATTERKVEEEAMLGAAAPAPAIPSSPAEAPR